ncbi:hypothetical protein C2S52_012672 [Perilla frutescens var. hirtella]|nr:hypothetical protein C2S52_012672 [Perilla frutescens var. hirtella]
MAITTVTGDGISEAGIPLLEDVVTGSVSVEVAERFAYNGICSNLITYLTGPLPIHGGGGGERQCVGRNGDASDAAGRFRRRFVLGPISYNHHRLCDLYTAAFHSSNSSSCKNNDNSNCSPPAFEVVFFFFSLYLVAFGQGGHKPCVQAFGADQFDEEDEAEFKAKSSFFNWWYFSMNGGILAAILVLNYVQEYISWELGFGIPCIVMCLALVVFLLGSMTYRFHISSDERNPFVRIGRVFVKAARNWKATPAAASMEEKAQGIPSQRGAKLM